MASSNSAAGALGAVEHSVIDSVLRIFALSVAVSGFTYVFNIYLTFWHGWPGAQGLFGHLGILWADAPAKPLSGGQVALGILQVLIYVLPIVAIVAYVTRTSTRTLHHDAQTLSAVSAYIARAAFWAVLLVGIVDGILAFLHVEGLLHSVFGKSIAETLEKAVGRGTWVHIPLMIAGMLIAIRSKGLGFIWLALLVVVAELNIVILRFVFSYEQAFMADLVRFWYAALFLFSSAYTLVHEGHVRVDVLYAGYTARQKAWVNTIGSVFLGAPVCWVILSMGMASKNSVITGPLLIFEITQSGFGMYVKYLLAGFLLVYALSMLVQFMSSFLENAGVLLREPDAEPPAEERLDL